MHLGNLKKKRERKRQREYLKKIIAKSLLNLM